MLVILSTIYSGFIGILENGLRQAEEQPQSGANYTGDYFDILENSLRQEQTILVILSTYWRTGSDRSKLYCWFHRHTGEQPQAGANYTGDFIDKLQNILGQEQTKRLILSTYWRTTSDRSKLYWWFYRRTGEQPQTGANYTGDFIDNLYLWFYRHTGKHLQTEAKLYWYWWFYRHTGEQPQTGANYIGDFIGILENSLCQEQTILVILSAYWRTASDKSKLFRWFYQHTGEQPQAGAN